MKTNHPSPIGAQREAQLQDLLARIGDVCGKRGILLKPFFDDAAQVGGGGGGAWGRCVGGGACVGWFVITQHLSSRTTLPTKTRPCDVRTQDDHSAKLYGHVTASQFKQCLNVKVGIRISDDEAALLADKFHHDDLPEVRTDRPVNSHRWLFTQHARLQLPVARDTKPPSLLSFCFLQLVNYVAFSQTVDPPMGAFEEMVQ